MTRLCFTVKWQTMIHYQTQLSNINCCCCRCWLLAFTINCNNCCLCSIVRTRSIVRKRVDVANRTWTTWTTWTWAWTPVQWPGSSGLVWECHWAPLVVSLRAALPGPEQLPLPERSHPLAVILFYAYKFLVQFVQIQKLVLFYQSVQLHEIEHILLVLSYNF